LNLNQEPSHNPDELDTHTGLLPESIPLINTEGQPIWKVLVFDNLGRDVISSVGSASRRRGELVEGGLELISF
jgi:hypothetical protein